MSLSLFLMAAIGLAMLANGILRPGRLWEAPTWVGFIFVAFIVPQAIYIERSGTGEVLDAWFAWLYITGCLAAFWGAFVHAKTHPPRRIFRLHSPLDDGQLVIRALVVLGLGAISLLKVRQIAAADELGTAWTGVVTFFYLIFQFIFMALSIAAVRWLKTRRTVWIVIGAAAFVLALIAIGANAKRSLTAEVVFIAGASLYFARGWVPPRTLVVAAMVMGTVLVHQVGPIRDYVKAGYGTAFDAVWAGVPFENFAYFNLQKAPELTQGVVDIYRADQTGRLDGPAFMWNHLVHRYVPAFIVGRSTKEGLKFTLPGDYRDGLDRFNWNGATRTGFSDTYTGYSIFGVGVFGFIGWLMGTLYVRARAGAQWALFLYPLLINDSMFMITESTARFFSGAFFVVLVTIFLFWRTGWRVARRAPAHRPRRATLPSHGRVRA